MVGVEPTEAQVAAGRPWAPHTLAGLAPPIPQMLLERQWISEILPMPSANAWRTAQQLHRRAGLPVGPASGAAIAAALALRERGARGPVVAVCSCSIVEYLELAPPLE